MWGFFSEFFLVIWGLFYPFAKQLITMAIESNDNFGGALLLILSSIFFLILLLFFLIYVAYIWVKIVFRMLMRIALLAFLIVVSPLAFAFYASDVTEHWTRRWLSMFLGTTFEQVVVILVIYVGMGLVDGYIDSSSGGDFTKLVIAMVMSLLVLILADKVPGIVNRDSQGLFTGIGAAVGLAAKGTILAAAVVGGAAAGALAAGGGGLAGGGGGLAGGGSAGGGSGGVSMGGGGAGGIGPAGGGPAGGGPGGGAGGMSPGGGSGAGQGSGSGGFMSFVRNFGSPGSAPGGASGSAPGGASGGASPSGWASGGSGSGSSRLEGAFQGARRGMRFGQEANVRMNDIARGNFLMRHSSSGDDSASHLAGIREDMAARQAGEQRREEALNRLIAASSAGSSGLAP